MDLWATAVTKGLVGTDGPRALRCSMAFERSGVRIVFFPVQGLGSGSFIQVAAGLIVYCCVVHITTLDPQKPSVSL